MILGMHKDAIREAAAPNITADQARYAESYNFRFLIGQPLDRAAYLMTVTCRYWQWRAWRRGTGRDVAPPNRLLLQVSGWPTGEPKE